MTDPTAELYPCGGGDCLHVTPCSSANNCLHATPTGGGVDITCDSNPGKVLHATDAEWKAFVGRIRADLVAENADLRQRLHAALNPARPESADLWLDPNGAHQ